MKPSVRKILLNSAAPYSGAQLVLDFVGSRSNGQPYYMLNGATYPLVDRVPGWTYTGGTAAGTGSYAARADGSLQFFPSYTNLLLQSQTLDNASWTKSSATISADATTAPDGTTTADKIVEAAAASSHAIIQASAKSTVATTYTFSVYLKADTRTRAALWMNGAASGDRVEVGVNLSTGALLSAASTAGGFTAASATVVAAGNGYYRVTLTGTSDASASVQGRVFLLDNVATASSPSYTGDGTSGIYAWGAQLELGSTASTYIPTTTAAVTVATPRITDAGYWAEEARTNLYTYSQEFDNAAWTKTAVTVTANQTSAPDGTSTADLMVEAASANFHFVNQVKGSAATHAHVVYAKATGSGSKRYLVLSFQGAGVYTATFDVQAGTVTATSGAQYLTSEITSVGNGWYRCTATFTATGAGSAYLALSNSSTLGLNSYTGDGVSGLYIWQADLQAGSFATSPIPTTSVAVTRAADVGSISPISIPSVGTAFVEGIWPPSAQNVRILGANGTTVTLLHAAPTGVGIYNGTTSLVGTPAPSSGAAYRGASTWTASSRSVVTNANTVAADANSQPAMTRIDVGWEGGNTAHTLNAAIRRIVIYPRAFANSELQAITTAGAY